MRCRRGCGRVGLIRRRDVGTPAAVRGSFSALLGDEDDLDGRDALNQRVAAAGDHGVVVDSVRVSVLL